MKDLKFSSQNEALQHLADITGKKIKIAMPKKPEKESFIFGGMVIDVSKLLKDLNSNKLKPSKTINDFPIEQYAEQMLALKKEKGYDQNPYSIFIRVDMDFVKNLQDSRIKEPGIAIETSQGVLLVDGHHRLTKLYLEGETGMKVHIISNKDAKKYLLRGKII